MLRTFSQEDEEDNARKILFPFADVVRPLFKGNLRDYFVVRMSIMMSMSTDWCCASTVHRKSVRFLCCQSVYQDENMFVSPTKMWIYKSVPLRGIEPRPRPWKGHILTDRLEGILHFSTRKMRSMYCAISQSFRHCKQINIIPSVRQW